MDWNYQELFEPLKLAVITLEKQNKRKKIYKIIQLKNLPMYYVLDQVLILTDKFDIDHEALLKHSETKLTKKFKNDRD